MIVYRIDLTDNDLRLRSVLGAWRVALAELESFGAWAGQNVVRLTRRDGRSWSVLSDSGVVEFAEVLGRAAPGARVTVNPAERAAKLFEGGR